MVKKLKLLDLLGWNWRAIKLNHSSFYSDTVATDYSSSSEKPNLSSNCFFPIAFCASRFSAFYFATSSRYLYWSNNFSILLSMASSLFDFYFFPSLVAPYSLSSALGFIWISDPFYLSYRNRVNSDDDCYAMPAFDIFDASIASLVRLSFFRLPTMLESCNILEFGATDLDIAKVIFM